MFWSANICKCATYATLKTAVFMTYALRSMRNAARPGGTIELSLI